MAVTGAEIAAEIQKYAGYPYVWGGTGPSAFDCSGLVQYTLDQLGVTGVPRTSEEQWAWVQRVPADRIRPGDLVFAQFPGDNAPPGHVGIYVGGGRVLSAEDPAHGVGYDTLADWGSAIVGYGRVPAETGGGQTALTSDTGSGGQQGQATGGQTQTLSAQSGSVVSQAADLLHGAAESLNWFWQFFQPGQGWRVAFGAGAVVLGYMGLRTWGLVPSVKGAL